MTNSREIGEIEEKNGKRVWKIQNFSGISTDPDFRCYSPVFTTPTPISNSPRLRWKLMMYPSVMKDNKNYISIYVSYKSEFEVTTSSISLCILNDKDTKLLRRCISQARTFTCTSDNWGFSQFVSRDILTDNKQPMLVDDTFRISCSVNFLNPACDHDKDDSFIQMDHLGKLFDTGNYSDVTFVIGRRKLHLHKAILTGLSPVFQAMFEHDMKEKKEGVVKITDNYDAMKELFRYIYQRQVHDIKKNARDLFVVAEKYSVIGLKSLCELTLCGSLNVDNAVDNLGLAIMHNSMALKSRVTDFITSQLKDFVDREDFKQMDSSFKDEVFKAIVQKDSKK